MSKYNKKGGAQMNDIWFYEKDGKFLASDKYNTTIIEFPNADAREKCAEGFCIHRGFPDIVEALSEGLDVDRSPEAKAEFARRWNIPTEPVC